MNKCALRKTVTALWQGIWKELPWLVFVAIASVLLAAVVMVIAIVLSPKTAVILAALGILTLTIYCIIDTVRDKYRQAVRECKEEGRG